MKSGETLAPHDHGGNEAPVRADEARRLRQLVDTMPDIVWTATTGGAVDFLNSRWQEVTGLAPAAGLGSGWLAAVHPDEREATRAAWREAVANDARYDVEFRLRRHDGTWCWYVCRGVPQQDGRGALSGWAGTMTDIDDQRQGEVAQRERERFARRVLDNLFAFVGLLERDGTLLEANEAPLEAAGITLDDVRGKKFWDAYWWSYSEAVQQQLREACARALDGETVRYDVDVRMAGDTRMTIDFQLAPLRDEEGQITHLIPSAVDITDRLQAEAARAESERRMRLALEAARMGVWEIHDGAAAGVIDSGVARLFGLPADAAQITLDHFYSVVHPADRERVAANLAAAWQSGGDFDDEFRVFTGSGLRWVGAKARVLSGPRGRRMVGVNIDIDERKLAEAALQESEQRFRAMADNLPLLVWLHDAHGELTFINQTYVDYFGLAREEVDGDLWQILAGGDEGRAYIAAFQAAVAERRPFHAEVQVVRGDGAVRWLESWARPRFDAGGTYLGHIGASADVTDRRAAEEALRESEERLRLAAAAAEFGTYDLDLLNGGSVWSEHLKVIYGLAPEDPLPAEPLVAPFVHPADMERVIAAQARSYDPAGAGTLQDEYRIVRPDGLVRWVAVRGRTIFAGAGSSRRAARATGAVIDITQRKEAEEALRAMNEVLERRVRERTLVLQRQTERLRLLANQLTATEQEERHQLAQVLHDGLQQVLVAAKVQLSFYRGGDAGELVATVTELVDEALGTCRSLSYDLSPPILYRGRLPQALEWLARQFAANQRLTVDLEAADGLPVLPEPLKVFLFNAARELLLNAVKHSGSSRARVILAQPHEGYLSLTVADEGQGFDPAALDGQNGGGGFGLFSIRERLIALGGTLHVDARPSGGARFTLLVPLRQATL